MGRARFSEEQIIGVLNEAEAGANTADLAQRFGGFESTIYSWQSKYGELEVRALHAFSSRGPAAKGARE